MPKRATVEAFAATVESNKHVDAILNFYALDARTQENNNPPTIGRDALAERERKTLLEGSNVFVGLGSVGADHDQIRFQHCHSFGDELDE